MTKLATRSVSLQEALAWLERRGTRAGREGMARYGIVARKVFGVSVGEIQKFAKQAGTDHALALALWDTGWHEARLMAAFVGDPARLTAAQMDRWARQFENWADCDTVCFKLFDRSPLAWKKVTEWSGKRDEFVKRAAFALLASLALHDRATGDAPFLRGLALIEQAATDERNFVKKGVNWALRAVGERNAALNIAAREVATRLAASENATARWVGKDALRALASPAVKKRLAKRAS